MRLMSFTHTADAMRWRLKTVTRRAGWRNLKAGDRLLAVVKARGRKPGEPLDVLGVIEVVRKSREPLSAITAAEVEREGFGDLPPARSMANLVASRKREHSVKPEEVYDVIEACSPGPYLEVFARRERLGWYGLGDQLKRR